MESQVRFELTDWQTDMLESVFDQAEKAFDNDKPGMVVCNIKKLYGGGARAYVAFVDNETAKKIQAALGTTPEQPYRA